MKRKYIVCGTALVLCVAIIGSLTININKSNASKVDKSNVHVEFDINTTAAEDMEAHLINEAVFDSNYFSKPSIEYNNDLAILSVQMAACASSTAETDKRYGETIKCISKVTDKKIDFEKCRNGYLTQAYKDMGFSKDVYYKYDLPLNNTGDTVAYGIASRKIYIKGKEYNLVNVAVRSNSYGAEWTSNFVIKDKNGNTGFHTAAIDVYKSVKKYIDKNKLGSNTKIWMSGFSRGAAVANIAGAYLDRDCKNKKLKIKRDDVYVYSFATPQGIYDPDGKETSNKLYDNLISVLNEADVVPCSPPASWGYRRYGKVYTIPSIHIPSKVAKKIEKGKKVEHEGVSEEQINLAKRVSEEYYNIRYSVFPKEYEKNTGSFYIGFYVDPKVKPILDEIFDLFADSSEEYSEKWQNVVTDLIGYGFGQTKRYDEESKKWVTYSNIKQYVEDNCSKDALKIAIEKGAYSEKDYNKKIKYIDNLLKNDKAIFSKFGKEDIIDEMGDTIKFAVDTYYGIRIIGTYYGIGIKEIQSVSSKLLRKIPYMVKTAMPISDALCFKKNHYSDFYNAYLRNYNPATKEILVDLK